MLMKNNLLKAGGVFLKKESPPFKWHIWLVAMFLLTINVMIAQPLITNYTFSTTTTGSLDDLSTGATNTNLFGAGPYDDAATSTRYPIGWTFYFMGTPYTHFSVNSNGQLKLNTSITDAIIGTNVGPTANQAILAPFQGDNETGTGIRYRTTGAPGAQKLVVEWVGFYVNFVNISNAGNMQLWIDEATGAISYVYGEIYNSNAFSQTRSIGFSASNTVTTSGFVTIGASPTFTPSATWTTNTIAAGNGTATAAPLIANLGSAAQGSRRTYTWTPTCTVAPANPISLSYPTNGSASTTVQWVDNSTTEVAFVLQRSLDGITYTNVASVTSTTSAGTGTSYNSLQTGLTPTTLYYWRVISVCESKASSGLDGTNSTLGAQAISSTAQGGLWNSPATWTGGIVPSNFDNPTITAGSSVAIDVAVVANNLTVAGTLQWGSATNALTVTGNLLINAGGNLQGFSSGGNGQTINLFGNFTNNGNANLLVSALVFTGTTAQTFGGSGTFVSNSAGRALLAGLTMQGTGSLAINVPVNIRTFNPLLGSITGGANIELDNNLSQLFNQPTLNGSINNVIVTNMGAGYPVAPVVFGTAVTPWSAITGVLNTRYFSGNNVYVCTAAASIGAVAPTHTGTAIVDNLLWIGTLGTIGNPFATSVLAGTQYFYGGNLYTCTVGGTASFAAPPVHTSFGSPVLSGTARFAYVGTPATVSLNYDATNLVVRSAAITSAGSGYSNGSPSIVISPSTTLPTTAAAIATLGLPAVAGAANTTVQKNAGVTITGAMSINCNQGISVPTSATGGFYAVAPGVAVSGPTGIPLNITSTATTYTGAPSAIAITGGTLIAGATAYALADFAYVVANGRLLSVTLTSNAAKYSTPPTSFSLTIAGGAAATFAFPAGSFAQVTAVLNTAGQLTNFNVVAPGFGYIAAPTVALATANAAAFETAAGAPTARVGLYNLTLNNFTATAVNGITNNTVSTFAQHNEGTNLAGFIPTNRRVNILTVAGGLGLVLAGNLNLPQTGGTSLVLTSGIVDLGGNTLIYDNPLGYGQSATAAGFVANGTIEINGRNTTTLTRTFPFRATGATGAVQLNIGAGANNLGSDITRLSCTQLGAPSGASANGGGTMIGTRSYRIDILTGTVFGTPASSPTVLLAWEGVDNLATDNPSLFLSQSNTGISSGWTNRSVAGGAGTLAATGTRTSATATVGPIVFASSMYFGWSTSFSTPAPLNFVVTRSTNVNYNSIAELTAGGDGTGTLFNTPGDEGTVLIPFTGFTYQGSPVTGIRAHANGLIYINNGLFTSAAGNNWDNTFAAAGNGFTGTSQFDKRNIVAPFYDDMNTNPTLTALFGGTVPRATSIFYKVVGNVCTVEWFNSTIYGLAGPQLFYQVVLDGSDNSITFNYGDMQAFNGTQNVRWSYSCGLSGAFVQAVPQAGQVFQQQYENSTYFTHENSAVASWGANGLAIAPEPHTRIRFVPGTYVPVAAPGTTPPANDNVAGAITLTPQPTFPSNIAWNYNTLSSNIFTTLNATTSLEPICAGPTAAKDVWFTFNATNPDITVRLYASGGFIPRVEVLDAALNPLPAPACVVGTQGLTVTAALSGLTVTANYYVRVYHDNTGTTATATALISSGSVSGLIITPGTNYSDPTPAFGWTPANRNAVFRFSGGGGSGAAAAVTTALTGGVLAAGNVAISGGSGYTSAPTVTINSPDFGLTGEFGIVVFAAAKNDEPSTAILLTNTNNGACVTATSVTDVNPSPVITDLQANNNQLIGEFSSAASQSVVGYTNPGTFGNIDDDIWYRFTVPSGNDVAEITMSATASTFDPAFMVYNQTPVGAPLLGAAATGVGGTEFVRFSVVPGNTYLIRAYFQGTSTVFDGFDICVTTFSGPVNNNCTAATSLLVPAGVSGTVANAPIVDATLSFVSGAATLTPTVSLAAFANELVTVVGIGIPANTIGLVNGAGTSIALQNAVLTTANSAGSYTYFINEFPSVSTNTATGSGNPAVTCGVADDDVWYTFTGNGNLQGVTVTGLGTFDPAFSVYSGTCGALVLENCANATAAAGVENYSFTTTNAVQYFVRVYSAGNTVADPLGFTISLTNPIPACVVAPSAPSNGSTVCVSSVPDFSWPAVTFATSYDVFYNFGGTLTDAIADNVVGTSFTPTGVTTDGTWSWRVVPKNSNGDATGCATFTFDVEAPVPTGTTPDTRCGFGPLSLAATGSNLQWWANATGGTPLGVGSPFNTGNIAATTTFYVSAGSVAAGIAPVGTGVTTTATSGATPYTTNWEDQRIQYLITAAELTASGFFPGNLTSLGFDVTSASAEPINNFSIKIANTTSTVAASGGLTGLTGLTTVYNSGGAFTPVVGINTYPFGTAFNWNGTSNIMVEVCFDNADFGGNSTVRYTSTAFNSVVGLYDDGQTGCTMTLLDFPNETVNTERPNMIINGQTVCPGLRVPVVATITAPVDPLGLEVSGTPVLSQTICAGTPSNNVELINAIGSYDTYTWTPNTGFTGDGSGGNPFVFNPASTTNYTLNASDAGSGCTDQINFTVNVNPLPNFTATVAPATVCELGATNLSAANNVAGLVSNYTFAQTVGTYTPMVGGTTILTGAWDDAPATNTVPIGFTFNYRGVDFTSVNVNPNGYITFGATSALGYTPISSGTVLTGGTVAAWGRDLEGQATSEIKYLSSGGVFTIQWSDATRYLGDPAEVINFQIQLVQATGQIRLVYGNWANAVAGPGTTNGQVGLRGANNLDFNNRAVLTGGNWSASTAGASVAATTFYNESSTATKPVSGLTYSFTPPLGFTYAWSTTPASAFTSTVEDPGSVVPVLGTTDFNLVVTNAITSCPNTFTRPITVNPIAFLNGTTQTSTVCSGSPFSVALVGTNPVGTTYSWTAPVYAPNGVGMSGGAAATNQATLTQVVNNTSGVIKTATYTVTPSTGGCAGPAFTLVVTVYPALLPPNITSFSFSSPTAVNLQWNPVTTATSYIVSASNAPDITSGTYVETTPGVFLNNFSVVSAPLPAINLVSSSLYYYRIQSVNAVCGASPVSDVTPFITDVKVWDGDLGTNSQNWNLSGNWSPAGVPVATDNVLIPSPSVVASPIIQTLDPDGLANNLILSSNAVITIQANRALQVRSNIASSSPGATFNGPGRVLLNGTGLQNLTGANSFNNLTLNNAAGAICPSGVISINGIATINSGTLNSNGNLRLVSNASTTGIISGANGTGNVTGNVQVNRFMPGGLGYRYVSSPVTGLNTSDFDVPLVGVNGLVWNPLVSIPSPFPNCWIYDETIENVYAQYGWTSATGVSAVQLGRGYALIAPANHTASLVGPVNNGTLTNAINITRTGTFNGAGVNLLGNPYPSPISWSNFRNVTNSPSEIAAVVKRFSATGQYYGQYIDWNGTAGTGGATDNIALGQAFFITKINPGTTGVNFANADRTDITSTSFYEEQEQQVSNLLRMQLIGGAGADEFVLYFDQNATNDYDVNYDAVKFLSETAGIPNIYTNIDSLKVSINVLNALNHDMVIPMGIVAKTAGNYQVNVLEQANFAPTSMLFLEDRTLGIWSDLRTTSQYTVNLPVGEHNGRFFLHFRPAVNVQVANETCQQADGSVVISNNSTEQQWTASLLNTAGQVVAQSSGANITFNNLNDGTYTLRLTDANGFIVDQSVSIEAGINVEAVIAPLSSSHYYTSDVIEASVQNVVSGATYEWYLNGVLKGTGVNISMNVAEAGVYTLTLKMYGSSCVFENNTSFSVTQESTVGIETAIDASGFIVYPNPMRDVLNVKINDKIGFTTLSIHDASGRLIHTEVLNGVKGEQVIQVQMSDYAAGLYQITLEGDQKRSVAKFSKTK
jgi:hypothetical protein